MCKKIYAYMRISTKEERGKQRFTRQEQAIQRWARENGQEIPERRIYRDDASGKSFEREAWKELENDLQNGDTIVFKDICRFTREYENGFQKYMQLMNSGIDLIFIDNPTISTGYIRNMMDVADRQQNRIAKKTLRDTIELLLLVELDRAEQEREITVKRIKDGIAASPNKSGRPNGKLDKMTPDLEADIQKYIAQSVTDKTITIADLMRKHNLTRNTVVKYIRITEQKNKAK